MKDREGGREQLLLSHNDYEQDVPFWNAYAQGIDIIEADLRLRGQPIVVAHARAPATSALTLKELYIDPPVGLGAKADGPMSMVDLKAPQVMKPPIKFMGK